MLPLLSRVKNVFGLPVSSFNPSWSLIWLMLPLLIRRAWWRP
jgi:hypothetical protein